MTGIVLFSLITFSTNPKFVFSSAVLSVRMAVAQTSIRARSSRSKSRVRRCEVMSEATAMTMAAITSNIFTCLILSVHSI